MLPVLLLLVLLAGTVAAAAEEEGEGPKPKPFWPLTPREWAGIVLSALGLVVAGGSGIGAGGMILPMFILLFDMSNTRAAALTSCTVMVSRQAGRQVSSPCSCSQRRLIDIADVSSPLTCPPEQGGALTNTLFALRQRHPLADRPLINWDIVLLMEPTSIIGAVLGSLVHQVRTISSLNEACETRSLSRLSLTHPRTPLYLIR